MPNRRQFLGGGLGALALGLMRRFPLAMPAGSLWTPPGTAPSSPFLDIPLTPNSVSIGGLPFEAFYTGDSFRDWDMPYHNNTPIEPPSPSEDVDVVVVGGGLSGLATAWMLKAHKPVVLEFRDRFGGAAMGEVWGGTPFSLGGAYVITPDKGSFLDGFYRDLGLDAVRRESFPPDPMELNGKILERFWSGGGLPASEQRAVAAYADVVAYMADEGYPEIPLPDDPKSVDWVMELDGKTFRQDVEEQMGMPLSPLLAAGIQTYFHSSFCAGIDEVSAASGWNFVAAEEYGRWVFPGGNTYMVWALWNQLRQLDEGSAHRPHLRAGCAVVDVRLDGDGGLVTYMDADQQLRSIAARHIVMAGSKHIAKHIMPDLALLDPDKLDAMRQIETGAYLVANVLLDTAVTDDFYDTFLLGSGDYPMSDSDFSAKRPIVDVLRGDYNDPNHAGRTVLTLYWPHPYAAARALWILEGYERQAEVLARRVPEALELFGIPTSAVRQVRLSRWGHAMPLAHVGFIAQGYAALVQRPVEGRIHFVNQDNWALPAVENAVLDAATVAETVDSALAKSKR